MKVCFEQSHNWTSDRLVFQVKISRFLHSRVFPYKGASGFFYYRLEDRSMTIDFHAHPVPEAFRKWLLILNIDVIKDDGFPVPQWSKGSYKCKWHLFRWSWRRKGILTRIPNGLESESRYIAEAGFVNISGIDVYDQVRASSRVSGMVTRWFFCCYQHPCLL